jgi:hypothetical protein
MKYRHKLIIALTTLIVIGFILGYAWAGRMASPIEAIQIAGMGWVG